MKTLHTFVRTACFFSLLLLFFSSGCVSEDAADGAAVEGQAEGAAHEQPAAQNEQAVVKPTGETQTYVLTDTDYSFKLPSSFIHSDRSRIKKDIPAMQEDPLLLAPLQGGIDDLRSEDDFPDLFVDTAARYRFFLVHNFEPLELDKEVQGAIEKYLDKRMDFLGKLMRDVQIERKSIEYFELPGQNRFKVRYLFTDKKNSKHFIWLTMYFLATENQSFYVLVASDQDDDMEASVNTLQEG